MMSGIFSPEFLQAAGRAGKTQKNILSFIAGDEDMVIYIIAGNGEITINTTKNGEVTTDTLIDPEAVYVLSNDANTLVTIIGDVTKLYFYNEDVDDEIPVNISNLDVTKCKSLIELQVEWCQNLTSLDLSKNSALNYFDCSYSIALQSLELSNNTLLSTLYCGDCDNLNLLDLSTCTVLSTANFYNCKAITLIKYPATNQDISTKIAAVITNATATDGTVYTDSQSAYYSTIADAATAKGWTIEQL